MVCLCRGAAKHKKSMHLLLPRVNRYIQKTHINVEHKTITILGSLLHAGEAQRTMFSFLFFSVLLS